MRERCPTIPKRRASLTATEIFVWFSDRLMKQILRGAYQERAAETLLRQLPDEGRLLGCHPEPSPCHPDPAVAGEGSALPAVDQRRGFFVAPMECIGTPQNDTVGAFSS